MKPVSLVLISLALTTPASFASPEEDESKAKSLVKQLGSDSFKVREEAAKELIALGGGSKKALEEGCKSTDAEMVERCRKLLPYAFECYLKQLFDEQVADTTKTPPVELPGIKRWLEVAGKSGDSKLIYIEMLGKHRELLFDVTGKPETLTERYHRFVREVSNRFIDRRLGIRRIGNAQNESMSRAEMALFLYLATDPALKHDDPLVEQQIGQKTLHLLDGGVWKAVLEPRYGRESFKTMFVEYLTREPNELPLRKAIEIVLTEELKQAVPSLLKVAGDKTRVPKNRSFALYAAGKLSGNEILPELVSLFDDDSPITNSKFDQPKHPIQMRDIALGMALVRTNQTLTDYGFDRNPPSSLGSTAMLSHTYFSFPSDEVRTQALKKWKAFAEKEKLFPEGKK